MPSLIDLTEKDARAALQKVGLDLGDIKMEYQTNPAKIGNVIEFHAGGLNDRLAANGEKWPLWASIIALVIPLYLFASSPAWGGGFGLPRNTAQV